MTEAVVTKKEHVEAPQHPNRRTQGYGPVAAIVVVVLTYFGSQLLAGIIIGLAGGLFGSSAEEALTQLQSSTTIQFAYIALVEAITLSVLWRFMKARGATLKDIGLGRGPSSNDIGPALLTFMFYFFTLIVVTGIVSQLIPGIDLDQEQQLGFESVRSNLDLLLVFISLAVLPPLVEEILVRGFMYTGLRKSFTVLHSALIASVIFGIAHLQLGSGAPPLWIAAIDTALLSMFLVYLRERTGALWAPIMVHAFKNSVAFFLIFVFMV